MQQIPPRQKSGVVTVRVHECKAYQIRRFQSPLKDYLPSTTTCTSTANTATRISELKCFNAKDGLHYISAGYKNRVVATLNSLLSSPQRPSKPQCHFLRGFKSPVGSTTPPVHRLATMYTEPGWNGSEPAAQHQGHDERPTAWLQISSVQEKIDELLALGTLS